jgi:hypothetical protein
MDASVATEFSRMEGLDRIVLVRTSVSMGGRESYPVSTEYSNILFF